MRLHLWIRWETPTEQKEVGEIIEKYDRFTAIQRLMKAPYALDIITAGKVIDIYNEFILSKKK